MKKIFVGILVGLALGAAGTWLALHRGAGVEPAKTDAAVAEKPKENPLHLTAAQRTAIGLTLAKPASSTLAPEVKAFGRVLDPAPLISLVAESETARAALAASEKNAARVQELYDAGTNASAQVLEVAEAAAARDRVAAASARARLIAGWGRPLADSTDLKTIVAELESGAALVRLDALPGDLPAAGLKKAAVGLLGGGDLIDAEIIGPAPVADPQLQGASFLAFVGSRTLAVGAALRATLAGPGETEKVLVVPRTAVVYHQGSAWLYVLGGDDTFQRKLVTLGRAVDDGVAITSGLEETDQVVVTSAGQLLSAELQAGGAPGEG